MKRVRIFLLFILIGTFVLLQPGGVSADDTPEGYHTVTTTETFYVTFYKDGSRTDGCCDSGGVSNGHCYDYNTTNTHSPGGSYNISIYGAYYGWKSSSNVWLEGDNSGTYGVSPSNVQYAKFVAYAVPAGSNKTQTIASGQLSSSEIYLKECTCNCLKGSSYSRLNFDNTGGSTSKAVTYTATLPNVFTITYDLNNGTGTISNTKHTWNNAGYPGYTDTALPTTEPARTGYKFLGWSFSQTATTADYAAGASVSNLSYGTQSSAATNGCIFTLYAVWEQSDVTYTIKFLDGALNEVQTSTTVSIPAGKTPVYTDYTNKLTTAGYHVTGGSVDTANKIININCALDTGKIVYHKNYGTVNTTKTQYLTYGAAYSLYAADTWTRDGYSFIHWNTDEYGEGDAYSAGSAHTYVGADGGVTHYYAIWKDSEAPKVTISSSGSDWCKSISLTITVSDNAGIEDEDNSYQYCLTTESSPPSDASWKNYTSGTAFTCGAGLTGAYNLFVKRIVDEAGNYSTTASEYHLLGTYKFDNTGPEAPAANYYGVYSGSKTFTISFTDADCGVVSSLSMSDMNGSTLVTTTNSSFSYTYYMGGANLYYVVAKDGLGNSSTYAYIVVIRDSYVSNLRIAVWSWHNNNSSTGTVTALSVWEPVMYTVTYNPNSPNGGAVTGSASKTYHTWDNGKHTHCSYTTTAKLSSTAFTLDGWKHTGWDLTADKAWYEEPDYGMGETVLNMTTAGGAIPGNHENIQLYAHWVPITYTVRLYPNASDYSRVLADTSWTWNTDHYEKEFGVGVACNIPEGSSVFGRDSYATDDSWYTTSDCTAVVTNKSGTAVGFGDAVWDLADSGGAVINLYAGYRDGVAPKLIVNPAMSSNSESDDGRAVKNLDVTISVTEYGSGLATDNAYQYSLSTSYLTKPSTWSAYSAYTGTASFSADINIGDGLEGYYYLWVKSVKDNQGNVSVTENACTEIDDTVHVYGPYAFDNEAPTGSVAYIENNEMLGLYEDTVVAPTAKMVIEDAADNLSGIGRIYLELYDKANPDNRVEFDFTGTAPEYECVFNLYSALENSENIETIHMAVWAVDKVGNIGPLPVTERDFGTDGNGEPVEDEDVGFEEDDTPGIDDEYERDAFRVEARVINKHGENSFRGGDVAYLEIYTYGYVESVEAYLGSLTTQLNPQYDKQINLNKTAIPVQERYVYTHKFFIPLYATEGIYTDNIVKGYKNSISQKRNVMLNIAGCILYDIKTILK